jgi:hypothetical protein
LFPLKPPVGPHEREQHACSHCTWPGGQTTPATLQPPVPVPPGSPHVPFWFVPTLTQFPLQHWLFEKQTSPCCTQYDT